MDSLTEKKLLRKKELLIELKKRHEIYRVCTNEQKIRLFEASASLIEELSTMGYVPLITESLLMFGGKFFDAELKGIDEGLGLVFGGDEK